MGLLDELRQKAASISGTQEMDAQRFSRNADKVEKALRQGFSFFLELAGYLNVIQPENKRAYVIPRLGNLEGMRQSEFFTDYRTTSVLDKQRMEHFYLRYLSSADRVISTKVDFQKAEKLRNILWESHVEFTHEEERNKQHRVVSGSFEVPYKVRSEVIFRGEYPNGRVRVACRNIDWLGLDEFVFEATDLDVSFFEDFVRFIFGEPNTVRQRSRHHQVVHQHTLNVMWPE